MTRACPSENPLLPFWGTQVDEESYQSNQVLSKVARRERTAPAENNAAPQGTRLAPTMVDASAGAAGRLVRAGNAADAAKPVTIVLKTSIGGRPGQPIEPLLGPRMRPVVDVHHVPDRKLRIALGGCQPFMSEQFLDRAQVRSFFEHVCAEGVTQRVGMNVG